MKEQHQFSYNHQLNIGLLHAFQVEYAYPRHSHDQYVICLIEAGVQSFTHKGTKHVTPASGLILINPGVVHTGESATDFGFQMRSLYPSMEHMRQAAYELTGRHHPDPFFGDVRVDDPAAAISVSVLHQALINGGDAMECESRFITTLAQLVKRHADQHMAERALGNENYAVQNARRYIEENFAEPLNLSDVAGHVGLSPYYFLRVFRAEVGMPPHAYLQDVRIRRAQRMIEVGKPLADVAFDVGFSSQSHLTRRFKQTVNITPGEYAKQVSPLRPLSHGVMQ